MKVWVLLAAFAAPLGAQSPGFELFEREIRPVLVNKCYGCHSSKLKTPMGGLALDTKSGTQRVMGKLLGAVRYNNPQLRMPPMGRLPDGQIAAFEKWIALGAPDPRQDTAASAPLTKAMDIETGRKWWAFQPLRAAPKRSIDFFILAKLNENKLKFSPEADRRTLVQRAYLDLTGLRPSYEETEAFVADSSPDSYARLIERLLASPHYGERWGRYWLDVARYGEDNPTSEATNPPYPFAWRYRDWVIEAVNQDVPYDRFVKLQLAADMMPDAKHLDLRALGYLGAAPVYHKDARLSKEVIETLYTDDWDERVDTVSRGLLGLTVACARCHDHKFDPILTKDYYSLAGVFASTVAAPRPLNEVDPETETRFAWAAQRLFFLSYVANLMRNEPGSKPEEAAAKSERYAQEVDKVKEGMAFLKADHPEMYAYLDQIGRRPRAPGAAPVAAAAGRQQRRRPGPSDAPFINAVFDAGLWVDGSDADLTTIEVKPGVARDLHVLPHANVSAPGVLAPRQFLTVLSKADTTFHQGSGRLELANRIFSDAGPLTARVIVNRVWAWHFGKPLVATASDFGTQGEKPTHPELLDDLSARFVANGWSLKWLHREIMLSAAYKQASRPREDGTRIDPTNRLLWRMNPRRLDIEAYRDSLLAASGDLDETIYGLSMDLDMAGNNRRTVYGRVSRGRLNSVLALYDFPDATMTSPARDLTTTPLQQLFVMNSQFMQDRAAALVKTVENEPDKIRAMYHRVLLRDPTPKEIDLGASFLNGSALPEYAQALLSTNEVIFWP